MEWADVFTGSQLKKLIEKVSIQLNQFLDWAAKQQFEHEVEIAGFYGEKCDKLVSSSGVLMEKVYSYDNNETVYHPASSNILALIEKYKISPRHIVNARSALERLEKEQLARKEAGIELSKIVAELNNLMNSPAIDDLIKSIHLGGSASGFGDKLFLSKDGLVEINGITEARRKVRSDEIHSLIMKYNLTAQFLIDWRKKIET